MIAIGLINNESTTTSMFWEIMIEIVEVPTFFFFEPKLKSPIMAIIFFKNNRKLNILRRMSLGIN